MRFFCASCGKLVEEGEKGRERWYPFDSKDCAAAYGIRAGVSRVERGDRAQVGLAYSTTRGLHASKAQAFGTPARCARCSSEDAVYFEAAHLHSFTCFFCGLEYVELPDGTILHSRDDEAKNYLDVGESRGLASGGLRALREALRDPLDEGEERSRRNPRRRQEDVEDERSE